MSLLTPIIDQAIKTTKEEEYAGKKKTSFWASETETMAFEIYHRWMGTTPTNPMDEQTMMMLNMRKLTEEAVVALVRKSGKLVERLANEERCYFEWGPNKVPISGYPDLGIVSGKEEILVEIKTFYGQYQNTQVASGNVKTNYLKQLMIYMYYFKMKHGLLYLINQGTGERYEYEVYQQGDNPHHFVCTDTGDEFNLEDTFKFYEKIYVENILKKKEPAIEYLYKYDIKKIDWENTPKAKISKARSNKAVIGDWQILYSDFKDMIVKKQGTCLGYSDEELKYIREKTAGYTTKKENKVKFDPSDLE